MKTIALHLLFLLIAYKSFGQSDSVTISLQQANRIEQKIRKCELREMQFQSLMEAEQQQQAKLASLHAQLMEQINKFNLVANRLDKAESKAIKEEKKKKLWRSLVAIAFFGGILTPTLL